MKRSLQAQIAEVEREIALRAKVYPGLVRTRKMSEGAAAEHRLIMECVLDTLRWLEAHRDEVKALMKETA